MSMLFDHLELQDYKVKCIFLQESAESRKRELANLLSEHAQIVQEVESCMSTSGDGEPTQREKENAMQ